MKKLGTLIMLVALGTMGCSGSTGNDDPDLNLDDIKADNFFSPTQNGNLPPGEQDFAELSDSEQYHAWDFTLSAPVEITLTTSLSSDDRPDTVMYLYKKSVAGTWGKYIAKNDNISSDNLFSMITLSAEAGTYKIIVRGKTADIKGRFALEFQCQGDSCNDWHAVINECPTTGDIDSCFAEPENYDLEGATAEEMATACAGWAEESLSECGLSCYFNCDDEITYCDDEGQFWNWVWDDAVKACHTYAQELAKKK